jgi:hypothetical protein
MMPRKRGIMFANLKTGTHEEINLDTVNQMFFSLNV